MPDLATARFLRELEAGAGGTAAAGGGAGAGRMTTARVPPVATSAVQANNPAQHTVPAAPSARFLDPSTLSPWGLNLSEAELHGGWNLTREASQALSSQHCCHMVSHNNTWADSFISNSAAMRPWHKTCQSEKAGPSHAACRSLTAPPGTPTPQCCPGIRPAWWSSATF
jgi:hypothetical protein